MKRLCLFLLLASVSFSCIAQSIDDVFYIYRNDGDFNAFLRDEVISIEFSYEDEDGNNYDEIVTQIINTEDSIYKIPLAAIDSISFLQPETIYQEDAIPLEGTLFDYLINSDGMTLTFANNTPTALLPKPGEKLVAMELTDKLPYGFLGKTRQISSSSSGIKVTCDSVELDEVVKKFYGLVIMNGGEKNNFTSSIPWRAPKYYIRDYDLPNLPINIPIDVSAYIAPLSIFDFNGKAEINVNIIPSTTARVTLVVDGILSHYKVHVVSKLITKTTIDICGEAKKDFKLNLLPNDGNYRGPWGIPLYFAIGPLIEFTGKAVNESSIDATFDVVSDITYYPQTFLPGMTGLSPIINKVTGYVKNKDFHYNLDRTGAKGELKSSIFFRAGVSTGNHKDAWLGIEAQVGAKCDVDFMFDFNRLKEADFSTIFYDELKNMGDLEIKPYYGVHFMASADDDHKTIKIGKEFDIFDTPIFKGGLVPTFSETNLTLSSNGTSAKASANISGACPIPYTVGFSIFDSDNNRVGDPLYYDEKYSFANNFSSYSASFDNLNVNESYKLYPTFKLFGYPILASPSSELKKNCPVTLSDFIITEREYIKEGFTHDGIKYDYCFKVNVTATLPETEDVRDWGYIYRDPNGKEGKVSCAIRIGGYGPTFIDGNWVYFDDRWSYYRNGIPPFTCTLIPYIIYFGSNEPLLGEVYEFPLTYNILSCPDNNHPHMIDLGLPSETKWSCCNVGASNPEDYGNYYAWGETITKNFFSWKNYSYGNDTNDNNRFDDDEMISLGNDIAGSQYDVAYTYYGKKWRMPSKEDFEELMDYCTYTLTEYNGIKGGLFTGLNGNKLFMPAAGYWDNDYEDRLASGPGVYWTSTQHPTIKQSAYGPIFGNDGFHVMTWWARWHGLPVRPIRHQ